MNLLASAPGKLVLLGEYAVLEGAPAISMAVQRRAQARIGSAAAASGRVVAPEVLPLPVPLAIHADGSPDWRAADAGTVAALSLVDQVLRGLAAEGLGARSGFDLELDTRQFFDTGDGSRRKLGLGSSAALTVALGSAVALSAGHGAAIADRAHWLRRLLGLHRRFQDGHGSGVDVATSVCGGVIAYRNAAGMPEVEALRWPVRLGRLFVWSGRSASTSAFLRQLAAWRGGHEAEYRQRMDGLGMISGRAVAAMRLGIAEDFIAAAGDYSEALRGLGRASGVEIWSDEHLRIAAVAAAAGCLYKPCGAGGGDVGVAFAVDDPERLGALHARLEAAGFATLALSEDPLGLQLETMETAEA